MGDTQESERLGAEVERLRKERDGYREDLQLLRARAEETMSAQLRLLSVSLAKEVHENFYSTLQRWGWIVAIAVTIGTAGGLWTFSDILTKGINTAIEKREKDIAKLREDVIQSVVDFKVEAKKSLAQIEANARVTIQQMETNATLALQEFESQRNRVASEGQKATIAIRLIASATPALGTSAKEPEVITIPLVVHVVYRDESENISDAQIKSQVDSLNRDFRAKNEDISKVPEPFRPFIADAHIEFVLAANDPSGKLTKGITRTKSVRGPFDANDAVKSSLGGGVDPWPTETYLNIWVCRLSNGLLEYSQFPDGPPKTDGVVVSFAAFGTSGAVTAPFNKGRAATHSIGHYLNLKHIWGDGGGTDSVEDTPPQLAPNYGIPQFPHISGTNAPNGDMFMNFMDYVDDEAMLMFTKGQAQRMRETLEGPRRRLGRQ